MKVDVKLHTYNLNPVLASPHRCLCHEKRYDLEEQFPGQKPAGRRKFRRKQLLRTTAHHILGSSYHYSLRLFFNYCDGLSGCCGKVQGGDVEVIDSQMLLPLAYDRRPTLSKQ